MEIGGIRVGGGGVRRICVYVHVEGRRRDMRVVLCVEHSKTLCAFFSRRRKKEEKALFDLLYRVVSYVQKYNNSLLALSIDARS
jgi:hypothetical protein